MRPSNAFGLDGDGADQSIDPPIPLPAHVLELATVSLCGSPRMQVKIEMDWDTNEIGSGCHLSSHFNLTNSDVLGYKYKMGSSNSDSDPDPNTLSI